MPTGEVLFSRAGEGDDSADDWDDTELLKEYDRAVRPVRALLAERMGMTVEDITSATESCSSSKSTPADKTAGVSKKCKKQRRKKNRRKQEVEWTVGDHCQAVYSVDGQVYEATVISIDHGSGTCCVQFVGYGNEEELSIGSLRPSLGSAVRRNQRQFAKNVEEIGRDTEDPAEHIKKPGHFHKFEERSSRFPPGPPPPPHSFGLGSPSMPRFSQGWCADMVPPPPPPHVLSNLPVEESEALSAMLMSWYMSGFHTGYFQGLKKSKASANTC